MTPFEVQVLFQSLMVGKDCVAKNLLILASSQIVVMSIGFADQHGLNV